MGINLATLYILDTISERKIDMSYKHFIFSSQNHSVVTMVNTGIYDVNAKCAADTYTKFLL